jgi:tRNA-dihydrouridine synthase B
MKLGNIHLSNNLILAPMQNVSTGPFRRFCRDLSKEIGLVCVPMLYTKRIVQKPKSVENDLIKIEEEHPISVQLIGSNADDLKKSIEFLESYKFDVLDLNAGCPSKRAVSAKEGGYLMQDFKTLNDLLKTAVKYSSKPVSIKIRSGYSDHFEIKELSSILNDSNIQFVVIHGRTVKERFQDSRIGYEFIKKLKSALTIPLIGNGDIFSPEDAQLFLDKTGVDGLMVGRGCIGYPEIFSQINNHLNNIETEPLQNSLFKMKKEIELFDKILDGFLNDGVNLGYPKEMYKFTELYKNSIWLSKGIENSTEIRGKLSKTKSLKELKKELEIIFN